MSQTPATDLAYSNPKVNYPAMRASGIEIAMLKVGQGTYIDDNMFAIHKAGCRSAGVKWGSYFFGDYRYGAGDQAAHYVNMMRSDWGDGPASIDIEYEKILGWGEPSGYAMYLWGSEFITRFEKETAGSREILPYINLAMYNAIRPYLKAGDAWSRHPLWLAYWTSLEWVLKLGLKNLAMWQEAGDVIGSWTASKVDYDTFFGTAADFCKMAVPAGYVPQPTPAPVPAFQPYQVKVTADYPGTDHDLNVRSGPGTTYPPVAYLSFGQVVTILAVLNGWGKTAQGWISLAYTQKLPPTNTVYMPIIAK